MSPVQNDHIHSQDPPIRINERFKNREILFKIWKYTSKSSSFFPFSSSDSSYNRCGVRCETNLYLPPPLLSITLDVVFLRNTYECGYFVKLHFATLRILQSDSCMASGSSGEGGQTLSSTDSLDNRIHMWAASRNQEMRSGNSWK